HTRFSGPVAAGYDHERRVRRRDLDVLQALEVDGVERLDLHGFPFRLKDLFPSILIRGGLGFGARPGRTVPFSPTLDDGSRPPGSLVDRPGVGSRVLVADEPYQFRPRLAD